MKIAIIGSAPSSMYMAPYGDPEYRIWACSPGTYASLSRCDAFFELHRWEPGVVGQPGTQKPWFSPEYVQWMAMRDPNRCPVWMQETVQEIPASRRLPVEDLVQKYGNFFFTSSIAFMLACAIEDIIECVDNGDIGPHTIALFGVDMAACPHPDTKVLTADLRWVRAGDLVVGDELVAFDEEATPGTGGSFGKRMYRKAVVTQASRIRKPCYKITLEDGREIICSDEHKWLTHAENECRWKMTKDLVTRHHRPGRPTRIVKLMDTWEEDRSWEAGYLAAAFDGEGHLSQKLRDGDMAMLRAGFAQRDNPMSEEVIQACEDMGFALNLNSVDQGVNGNVSKYSIGGGRAKTMEFLGRVRPRRLVQKFDPELLGIMQKTGTVAVISAEEIGEQEVVGLSTTTGTFIAEGLATHNTEEYGYQRAGCQHFLLLAADLGIQIHVPPESDLLRPMPLYGISEGTHWMIKATARQRELSNRLALAKQNLMNYEREVAFLTGALDDLDYHMKTWGEDRDGIGTDPIIYARSAKVRAAIAEHDGRPVPQYAIPTAISVVDNSTGKAAVVDKPAPHKTRTKRKTAR